MNKVNQKNVAEYPHSLYKHLEDYLNYTKGKGLNKHEIGGVVLTVSLVTKNLALMTELLERYPSTFDAVSKTLCKKAIQFALYENEAALVPDTLDLSSEDETLFYLMLMVIAYIKGSSSFDFLRRIAEKKTGYPKATEAVYLANLTESLADFCPGDARPSTAA